jgi:hypothetical protein
MAKFTGIIPNSYPTSLHSGEKEIMEAKRFNFDFTFDLMEVFSHDIINEFNIISDLLIESDSTSSNPKYWIPYFKREEESGEYRMVKRDKNWFSFS